MIYKSALAFYVYHTESLWPIWVQILNSIIEKSLNNVCVRNWQMTTRPFAWRLQAHYGRPCGSNSSRHNSSNNKHQCLGRTHYFKQIPSRVCHVGIILIYFVKSYYFHLCFYPPPLHFDKENHTHTHARTHTHTHTHKHTHPSPPPPLPHAREKCSSNIVSCWHASIYHGWLDIMYLQTVFEYLHGNLVTVVEKYRTCSF